MCDSVAVMYAGRVVESGPVRRIFNAPAHPYTRALVESIPRLGEGPRAAHRHRRPPARSDLAARRLRLPSALSGGDRSVPDRGAGDGRGGARPPGALLGDGGRAAEPVMILFEADGLTKHFPLRKGFFGGSNGAVRAVDGVSFTIEAGRTLGVVGESGCGKSTTAKLVLKLEEPTGGDDPLPGQEARGPGRRRPARVSQVGPGGVPGPVRLAQSAHARERYRGRAAGHQREADAAARRASGWPGCWSWSACPTGPPISSRTSSPAASASGSPSPARWRSPPSWSCSTSRCPRSTSPSARRSSTCCATCSAISGLAYLFIAHDLAAVAHMSHTIVVMYLGKVVEFGAGQDRRHRSQAPLHAGALRGRAAVASRRDARGDHPDRRGAEPDQSAGRLPLPSALPARDAPLLPGGAGAPDRSRTRSVLPPVRRRPLKAGGR